MTHAHDPRTIEVPPPLLDLAKRALAENGPTRGGRLLGISRNSLLSIIATGYAMPGTVALIEQRRAAGVNLASELQTAPALQVDQTPYTRARARESIWTTRQQNRRAQSC